MWQRIHKKRKKISTQRLNLPQSFHPIYKKERRTQIWMLDWTNWAFPVNHRSCKPERLFSTTECAELQICRLYKKEGKFSGTLEVFPDIWMIFGQLLPFSWVWALKANISHSLTSQLAVRRFLDHFHVFSPKHYGWNFQSKVTHICCVSLKVITESVLNSKDICIR